MPDSEPLPRRAPSRARRPWLDAAAVGGLLLAANALAAPQDPGWLSLNPSPWLLLPVLTGLRHGFRWGFLFGAAAALAVLSVLLVLHPGAAAANLIFFLSLPAAGLAAGGAGGTAAEPGHGPEPGDGRGMEEPSKSAGILTPERETSAALVTEHTEALKTLTVQRDHLLARLEEQERTSRTRIFEAGEHLTRRAEETDRIFSQLHHEREALTARLAEAGETIHRLSTDRRGLAEQLEALAARLEERDRLLKSLGEEHGILAARLADREAALQKSKERRDALNVRLTDRNPPPESMIARTPPAFRRAPGRNGVRRMHTTDQPDLPDADTADAAMRVPDASEPSGQRLEMPPPADAGTDAAGVPLDARLRALFDPGAGSVFSNLLQLLADIAGVSDAAVYQLDGPRLHRAALQGPGGMLPETLPLAGAEIAHLAVTRQSFVTCRQVWATVPAQDSPWLAAMPWPTDGFHSSAVLLIHRMHAGSVSWRTFSLIQMICRWTARVMKLHGLQGTGTEAAGGPPVVTPEVLRRAAMDAAAVHREQGPPSSSVILRLAPEAGSAQADHLLRTLLPQLRPTDLLALHPPDTGASDTASPAGGGAGEAAVEVLLTFSGREDAEAMVHRLASAIRADPALQGAVSIGIPARIGAPSQN